MVESQSVTPLHWRQGGYRIQCFTCLALMGLVLAPGLARAAARPEIAITNYSLTAGASLVVRGTPHDSIRIEAGTNVLDWMTIKTDVLNSSGTFAWVDEGAIGLGARFYRAWDVDYSSNIVGFVSITVPPGSALIANPFLGSDNRISALFSRNETANGVSVYKISSDGALAVNNFLDGWSDDGLTLLPGEGAFVQNPFGPAFSITFKGEVVQGSTTNYVPAGGALCSSILPQAGSLDLFPGFPVDDQDAVTLLTPSGPLSYVYSAGLWSPTVPRVRLGEAFWLIKLTNGVWSGDFVSSVARSPAYVITNSALTNFGAKFNFMTYAREPGYGRVFYSDGVTPLGNGFLAQLYGSAATNHPDFFFGIGSPVAVQSGLTAGYVRAGLVEFPGGAQRAYLQVRVWPGASGTTFEEALLNGAPIGRSEVFSALPGSELFDSTPPLINAFQNFSVCSHSVAIRIDGQTLRDDQAITFGAAQIEMQSGIAHGSIFYSLDGTDPKQGSLYAGSFAVSRSATIRAVVYTPNFSQWEESCPVALTVVEAPSITRHPTSLLLPTGATANFSAEASGSEPLHYQWQFNGIDRPGASAAALQLSNVQTTDAGDYRLIVANAAGVATSEVATLTVQMAPSVVITPLNTNVPAGATVTFHSAASGTSPLFYQWQLNGVNIPGETNDTLTISKISLSDGGSYSVVVANEVGAVTSDPSLLMVAVVSTAGPPSDNFGNRLSLGTNLFAAGSNLLATREPGEPRHAGKFGSNSVWYTWRPPGDGIATLSTVGSSFDTLLAIYTGTDVAHLKRVAGDEDQAGFLTSELQFNASSNVDYQIAVDGFAGQQGTFTLSLRFEPTPEVLPVITNAPLSQTGTAGSTQTFLVGARGSGLWDPLESTCRHASLSIL